MNYKIIKYRWWIIAASLLLTVGFSMSLLKLEIDPDLKNYFPKTMTSMVNTERIEEVFGNQDMIMMIFEAEDILTEATLKRVKGARTGPGAQKVSKYLLRPSWPPGGQISVISFQTESNRTGSRLC